MPEDINSERVDLRLQRIENDLTFLKNQAALKPEKKKGYSEVVLGVVAIVFGLLGTIVGGYMEGHNSLELEQKKFESELILQGLQSDSPQERKNYLLFITNLGLLQDKKLEQRIQRMLADTTVVIPRLSIDEARSRSTGEPLDDAGENVPPGGG